MGPGKTRNLRQIISLRWRRSPASLFIAAFCFSGAMGMLMLTVAWRIIQLGGTNFQVGAAVGSFFAAQVLTCHFIGPHQDKFGVKRMAMLAAALSACAQAALISIDSASMLVVMMGSLGIFAAMHWPPLMSWVSAGRNGGSLNKRMAKFNMHWSMGLVLGPLVGGYLFKEKGYVFAFAAGAMLAACGLVMLVSARRLHTHKPKHKRKNRPIAPDLPRFLPASRIALFASHAAAAAIGGVLPLLLREMQLEEDFDGVLRAGRSLLLMGAFFILGRTKRWHFSRAFLIGAQVVFAAMLLAVTWCHSGWLLAMLVMPAAIPIAVCYSSSQYYGLSSSAPRAASMAIHEKIIGCGIAFGAYGCGYLAKLFDVRSMYPVMAGMVMLAVAVQLYILLRPGGERIEI